MLLSQQTFLKWRQSVCALAQDFLQEQDFMERNLRQRGSKQLRKKMAKPTVHIEPVSPCKIVLTAWHKKYAGALLSVKSWSCEHAGAALMKKAPFFAAPAWR
jgi:hypothetical protein